MLLCNNALNTDERCRVSKMNPNSRKKVAYLGFFLSLALILSYIEFLIPFYFGIPGVKLGLANLAVLLILYIYGWKEGLLLNVMRVFLSGLLFGNFFMIMYSMAGALFSFIIMCLLKKIKKLSISGVSIGGGVFHNIGQIIVAYFVTKTPGVIFYLPVLLISGVVTGLIIGLTAGKIIGHINKHINRNVQNLTGEENYDSIYKG